MKKDGKVFCVIGDGMKNYLDWYKLSRKL